MGPRPLPRALEEDPNPVEVNPEGALGDVLLIEPVEKILAAFLVAELVGSASVVVRPWVDSGEITWLGLGGQASEWHVFQQAASKDGHGHPPVRGAHDRSPTVHTNQEDIWQCRAQEVRKEGGMSVGYIKKATAQRFSSTTIRLPNATGKHCSTLQSVTEPTETAHPSKYAVVEYPCTSCSSPVRFPFGCKIVQPNILTALCNTPVS